MRTCPDCGYDVIFATEIETEERVMLDARPTELLGERYYTPDPSRPERVSKMSQHHIGYGYGNHEITCPRRQRERPV